MASQEHDDIALQEINHAQSSGYEESGEAIAYRRRLQRDNDRPMLEFSLPQVDGGKYAWLFLAGCFTIEALVWGFPFSFGLFQEYYNTHEPFSSERAGIATIGTSATGIMYLSSPFTFAALQQWPKFRRYSTVIGLGIMTLALVASSFSRRVTYLIITQGIMYAIGGSLLYCPTILYLDEWFIRRKGFAYGVMWAGTGMSGVIIPFIMNWGLEKYGFRTMLRAWAVVLMVTSTPLLYFVKPRLPISMTSRHRRFDFQFLRTPTFWMLQAGNILEGLGFFIPSIYLPTYAQSLGLSSVSGTLTVSLTNSASVFGAVLLGSLIDKLHVTTVIFISTIGATSSVLLCWGLATSLPALCVFSLSYGLFAGGFSTTWTGIIKEVQKRERGADAGMIFGLLAAGRGIGSVISGPLSEALIGTNMWQGKASLGYGTGYGILIVFTGVTAALGGASWVWRRLGWI